MLRFKNIWLFIGWIQVGLVIYLSLIRIETDTPDFKGLDKLFHLMAYTSLMLWFGFCRLSKKTFLVIGIWLIIIGIALELIQGNIAYRSMSASDMLANSLGISLGWLLAKTPMSLALVYLENKFWRNN